MKRLTVVMIAVALVTVATPVLAQDGDPLALAAGGVLLPFFGNGAIGDVAIVEVASPRGPNLDLRMVFYDATCARASETAVPLTTNDVALLDTSGFLPNTNGLIAIRGSGGPLANPIHVRLYWINVVTRRSRVVEPITIQQYNGTRTWNPLRTGATFFAPLQTASIQSTLFLICPKTTIQAGGDPNSAFPVGPFPAIAPPFFPDYRNIGALRSRIYDTNEQFIVDSNFDCDCVIEQRVADLGGVYSNPSVAPTGTFTEVESTPLAGVGFAFTGYKAISVTDSFIDLFGRLSSNSRPDVGGVGPTPDNR